MNKNICPICESRQFTHIFPCEDYLVSKDYFQIIECQECGMRITKDFPAEDKISGYYQSEDYISHSDVQKGAVNFLYHSVRKFMLKRKANWVINASGIKCGDLLDFGSGTGYFANHMMSLAWNVSGVEVSDSARKFSKENFDVNAFPTLRDYVQYISQKANDELDVITLWHVLEHIESLDTTLSMFYKLLSVGGVVIVAVPNCGSYDAEYYQADWAAYDVPRHLWHFRPKHMRMLAEKHGFEVSQIKPMFFDGFYISMMSEKNRKTKHSFWKGVLRGSLGAIRTLLNKEESSSLVYVLKKK